MQKWEIKRLVIPLLVEGEEFDSGNVTYWKPTFNEDTQKAFEKANALAADGWELVGITEITSGYEKKSGFDQFAYGTGCSFTTGFLFMFKRPAV
jgi:hypothetical protein